jgi:hypothetical protein
LAGEIAKTLSHQTAKIAELERIRAQLEHVIRGKEYRIHVLEQEIASLRMRVIHPVQLVDDESGEPIPHRGRHQPPTGDEEDQQWMPRRF